jgi:hypothetical protein
MARCEGRRFRPYRRSRDTGIKVYFLERSGRTGIAMLKIHVLDKLSTPLARLQYTTSPVDHNLLYLAWRYIAVSRTMQFEFDKLSTLIFCY